MITLIKVPALFSPGLNDSIFQIQTNRADILYFTVQVSKPDGESILSNQKIYPTPAYRNGSYLNLQEVLKNVVQTTIKKNDNIIEVLDDVYSYRLKITEYIYNVIDNSVSAGDNVTTSFFNVFNGNLPKITMSDYDYGTLTATDVSIPKFLTNKPVSATKYWSTEYLYYLNNGHATGVDIHLNYNNGTTIIKDFPIDSTKKSGRINISPRALAVAGVSLTNLKSYSINLVAGSNIASAGVTRYYSNDGNCADMPVNVIWLNSLGGVDSYTYKNPSEKVSVDKVTIKTNPYAVNSAGYYTSSNDNIYQTNEQIITSDSISEYTLISDWLSLAESTWLPSVIISKAVFIELTNGKLLPVKVMNNSAEMPTRNTKGMKSFELILQTETGLISTVEDRISDNQLVGMVGTSKPDIVLQTTDFEYVLSNNGQVRV